MSRIAPALLVILLLAPWACVADAGVPAAMRPSMLVANVDLVELAPPDEQYDQADDVARAATLSANIRSAIATSDRYRVLDRGDADRTPPHRYNDCKACMVDWARQRGADYVLVTWVQKESRLILMVNMALIDVAHPDSSGAGGSVDLRGDTGETWQAGASQMLDRTLGVAMAP
jgi:hypothetical protein